MSQLHDLRIHRILFVYARDGEVKCINYDESIQCAAQMVRDGWKHTATIDPAKWIEAMCNDPGSIELTDEKINELRGAI